ncbi:MAG TPA: DNA-3-methyladenine glycosylase I [Actinomycetota bacterium]|nr:DNA-3-methyladenine glycosylase I [Actinomycetota bacterium]
MSPSLKIPKSGASSGEDGISRCWWCQGDDLYRSYHDQEWGRPVADDSRLFEKLCLEGFQSGLSWLIILRKRENFRKAFKGFDVEAVARYNTRSVERLLQDAGIVRHRGKIEATINNARRYIELIEEFDSLGAYVWSFEPDERTRPKRLDWPALTKTTTSAEATSMSKDLKSRGWAFVGPTTVYAFMEAMGLVNDHVSACVFRDEVEAERRRFTRPVKT